MSECLETDASQAELEAFCERAPVAPRVWVVLSANVFVAAYRTIAWALAASERVFVKPSRRDPVFAELLWQAAGSDSFELVDALQPIPGDHVHAYGSDETLEQVFAALPSGVTLWGYGSGLGAALVLQPGNEAAAAAGVAKDTVLFEQRGCLSPRCVGVSSACDVEAFAAALEQELLALDDRISAPVLPDEQRADLAWFANLARRTGSLRLPVRRGASEPAGRIHLMQSAPTNWPAPLLVAPPGRALCVYVADEPWLSLNEHEPLITCLGTDANLAQRAQLSARFPSARLSELGQMQRPPFDGPVDRRARPARTKL
jgi:acyl-CoA reductase-like NAD-dependent aldehyde dehydrogenase